MDFINNLFLNIGWKPEITREELWKCVDDDMSSIENAEKIKLKLSKYACVKKDIRKIMWY